MLCLQLTHWSARSTNSGGDTSPLGQRPRTSLRTAQAYALLSARRHTHGPPTWGGRRFTERQTYFCLCPPRLFSRHTSLEVESATKAVRVSAPRCADTPQTHGGDLAALPSPRKLDTPGGSVSGPESSPSSPSLSLWEAAHPVPLRSPLPTTSTCSAAVTSVPKRLCLPQGPVPARVPLRPGRQL